MSMVFQKEKLEDQGIEELKEEKFSSLGEISPPESVDDEIESNDDEKKIVEELPDIETLDEKSDYTPFLKDGVPEKLKKMAIVQIRATPIMEILTGFVIAGFIYYSGYMVINGQIEINNFFSFLTAMMLAYQPIRSLATINMLFYQGAAAAEWVFEVIDTKSKIEQIDHMPDLKIGKGSIEFKNVNYAYPKTKEHDTQFSNKYQDK